MPAGCSESNRGSNSRLATVYEDSPGRTSGPDRSRPRAAQSAGDGDRAAPAAAARTPEAAPSAVALAVLAVPLAPPPAALVPLSRLHEDSSPAPPAAAASRRNARRPWSSAIASLPFDLPSVRAPGNKDAVRPLTVVCGDL